MNLRLKTGSEGPKWDPYSYSELIVEHRGQKITYHSGLAVYLSVEENGIEIGRADGDEFLLDALFEEYAGITTKQFDRYYNRINNPNKCPHCGSKNFDWVDGYPGEQFKICCKCKKIAATEFNERAIM